MKLHDFARKKVEHDKITMLTCYDYPSARIIAETTLDCILVGDSVAMTVHGHASTLMADIEMMARHTEAVARGIGQQFLISDLPFLAHRSSQSETMADVKRLSQAGAQALKIEGGDPYTCNIISHIVHSGVPIMGHIGLTPQSHLQLGGYKIQGRSQEQAQQLLHQAQQLEAAGCFALVLECIPADLAQIITQTLEIPTIGIGAGRHTDGQVLVWHDMLGLQGKSSYRFVKQYLDGKMLLSDAIHHYIADIKQEAFPCIEHSF